VVSVAVDLGYRPRPQQRALHTLLDSHRFVAAVCHRRMGKTVAAVVHLVIAALEHPGQRPRLAYVAPTYRQGKAIAWDYLKAYARHIPGTLVHESELRIDFPTGAQVRIYGADNPDALRGIYLDGVVLDEFGLMDGEVWTTVIRPLLADRKGWALFIGTPNGRNQFYEVVQTAQRGTDGWAYAEYRASQTGLLDAAELAAAQQVMTADEYAQEFECSFEASVKGAIYGREIAQARENGRVTVVPYDPALLVSTDWDLGIDDSTAIVFSQVAPSGEIRVIDYHEDQGVGFDTYARVLRSKPYVYEAHYAPHDIEVRELTSGRTRLETARGLGVVFAVVPRVPNIMERISAARLAFRLCWFDAGRCGRLVEALQHYRWKDQTADATGNPLPVHDWASHGADAFGQLAVRHPRTSRRAEVLTAAAVRRAQRDDDPFRWASAQTGGRGGY
jgi:phage terminase large subunit